MKKKLIVILFIVIFILILSACTKTLNDPFIDFSYEKSEDEIEVYPVERQDFEITKLIFAKSIPIAKTTQYYEEVTGYFKEYKVNLLSEVKAGDVIAVLDSGNLDKKFRDQTIEYEKAKLKYEKAKLEFETTGKNESSMLSIKLDFEYEEFKYNEIIDQYSALELKAVLDGVVTKMPADPGDFINSKKPIVEIVDDSEIYVSFDSDESQGLRIGDVLKIEVRNSDEQVDAEIIEINGSEVILRPAYIHTSFSRTGTLVYIRILVDKRLNILVIDEDSVVLEAGRYFVYVMEDGVKSERDIKIGISDSGKVEVLFGLTEGELVVSRPYGY